VDYDDKDDNKDRTCNTTRDVWTAEEDATLLAHLRANEWSCSGFSGKHIFIVTQGRGGVQHSQYGGGKQDVRQPVGMRVLRVTHTD
jgi:hypothetical protein